MQAPQQTSGAVSLHINGASQGGVPSAARLLAPVRVGRSRKPRDRSSPGASEQSRTTAFAASPSRLCASATSMTCPRWSAAGSFTQAAWLDHIRRHACRPRSHWLRQCMSTLRGTAGRSAAAQFGSLDPCSRPDLGSRPHSPASPASALVPRRRARTRGPSGCNLAARARLPSEATSRMFEIVGRAC